MIQKKLREDLGVPVPAKITKIYAAYMMRV